MTTPVLTEPGHEPLPDEAARTLIRTALSETIAVEAAAGTGKTTVLVERIVSVLASGRASVEQIVAVTFTDKAAGEMKLRLRRELERARRQSQLDEVRHRNIESALARLEEAHINTIHAFCADLLRERPIEAGVDPRFETLTEGPAERLYTETFTRWLQQQLDSPGEGIRRALRRLPRWGDNERPTERLRFAGWQLVTWRDFPRAWQRPHFDRGVAIDRLLEGLESFAALVRDPANPRDQTARDVAPAERLWLGIQAREGARDPRTPRDDDGLEAALIDLADGRWFKAPKERGDFYYKPGVKRVELLAAHAAFLAELSSFREAADADLAAYLQQELAETVVAYEAEKARRGCLDFLDLLIRARDLVRDRDAVRAAFQSRFTHIFVDEFQDTDPLQAELILLLAADDPLERDWRRVRPQPGRLFIVGDPKQSIYRFRRADVGVYQDVRNRLAANGARCVELTASFRAVPFLQSVVNRAFRPQMTPDPESQQAAYVPLLPVRSEISTQPSLVALPVPEPFGYQGRVTKDAVTRSLPHTIAGFIDWLLNESHWTVTERETPGEPKEIQPRHLCILFRRFDHFGSDVTQEYLRALESRGLRHLLVGGKSFHARDEVDMMRTALAAIEWPDDELSVFGTLRGGLFAIGDELLFEYRQRYRRVHPFVGPENVDEDLQPVVAALDTLRALHVGRNRFPVADTIARLLEVTRAHAALVLRPWGEQALANVLHVAELARQYEANGGISFRGFVEQLRDEAASSHAPEAPVLEEGSDGIRIMTVHRAKGLEFPVVILADIGARLHSTRANRFIDPDTGLCALRLAGVAPIDLLQHEEKEVTRDRAEGIRVAYVAATRARDLLVVPAVGDERIEGWVAPLNDAIYPLLFRRGLAERAPACPRFGQDTVLARDIGSRPSSSVAPGLHWFEPDDEAPPGDGRYGVVWWDPTVLALDAPTRFGLVNADLLKEADTEVMDEGRRAHADWREQRSRVLENGGTPTRVIRTVRETAARDVARANVHAVEVIDLNAPAPGPVGQTFRSGGHAQPKQKARPSGPRFGALVHALLAAAPLDATRDRLQGLTDLQGRVLGATEEEAVAAVDLVERVLAHPVMDRARRAQEHGALRREVPISVIDADGAIVEGVVDLAFDAGEGWMVVDFKTDLEVGASLETYRLQVGLYATAIAQATGRPARGVLLRL